MKFSEDKVPVIIGVGQINDRPAISTRALDSLGLMTAAIEMRRGCGVRPCRPPHGLA